MPFLRPTFLDLSAQVNQDIQSAFPGADPLLRFSNLGIMGKAQANLASLHYGYLDWIAKQACPATATGEYLEWWAALKKVYRLPAAQASGQITITGVSGTIVPAGSTWIRGDGVNFTQSASATIGVSGTITATVTAVADPSGLTGAFGNTSVNSILTLSQSISGAQSSATVSGAIVGGADIETDDSLRSRMMLAYQLTPQGGAKSDYLQWALQVPGVTRSWCIPNGYGAGTVVVYIMLDVSETAFGGFPQGSNGVATQETRGVAATGDQLIVANYIYPIRPATALVYVVSPISAPQNFTISGISTASAATKAAISSAIQNVFYQYGTAEGGTVDLSYIESAIAAISGTAGFVITVPAGNITTTAGYLPTLGTVTYI